MQWETVIGLEIHAQLATNSKIFSGAATRFGAPPNTQACAVDLGLPGVLPVLNRAVVRMAVKFGLAIGARITTDSIFARKNYFYPDLPKGYQISQYEKPIVEHGQVQIVGDDGARSINVQRAHLEEDAGKSLHEDFHGLSGIDLNRAGTPLLEIVSAPDLRSAQEAVSYARKIHSLVRYLEICDGNMQEGSFRCDANVSVRPRGQTALGTRTEIKNLNSFRFLERAINFEVERQIDTLENNGQVIQETRLYDADASETRPMRTKEEANDYRYFPDPDLLPVRVDADLIEEVRSELPELPDDKRERFMYEFGLAADEAVVLTTSREMADYFEATEKAAGGEAKMAANWILGDLSGALNKSGLDIVQCPVSPDRLGALLRRIGDGTISGKIAKQVFAKMWQNHDDADTIIEREGLEQVTDSGAIEQIVDQVMARNPQQCAEYRAGKEKLMGFFVGQVMQATKGKANPGQVNAILKRKLSE